MESQNNDFYRLEQIFNRTLLNVPTVSLWSIYLDYIRRRNNLVTDTSGSARGVITQAYDFALKNIGMDKDSGKLWQDYIQFIRSSPGVIGGMNWQDQQKVDTMRKVYQRGISVPTQATQALWKEYDAFERSADPKNVRSPCVFFPSRRLLTLLGPKCFKPTFEQLYACSFLPYRALKYYKGS